MQQDQSMVPSREEQYQANFIGNATMCTHTKLLLRMSENELSAEIVRVERAVFDLKREHRNLLSNTDNVIHRIQQFVLISYLRERDSSREVSKDWR